MTYRLLKIILNSRPSYDNADGLGVDATTDTTITRDPNDYLSPRIDKFSLLEFLGVVVLILIVVYFSIHIGKNSSLNV